MIEVLILGGRNYYNTLHIESTFKKLKKKKF